MQNKFFKILDFKLNLFHGLVFILSMTYIHLNSFKICILPKDYITALRIFDCDLSLTNNLKISSK